MIKINKRIIRIIKSLELKSNINFNSSAEERKLCREKIKELCLKYNINYDNYDEHNYDNYAKYDEHNYDEHNYDEYNYDEYNYNEYNYNEYNYDNYDFDEFKTFFYENRYNNLVFKLETFDKTIYITIKLCKNGNYGVFGDIEPYWEKNLNDAYDKAYLIYKKYKD